MDPVASVTVSGGNVTTNTNLEAKFNDAVKDVKGDNSKANSGSPDTQSQYYETVVGTDGKVTTIKVSA